MRTAALAAVLMFGASVGFAGAPPAKPGASPAASPEKKAPAPEPGKNECAGVSAKDGAVIATATGDYQSCLREIKAAVAQTCDGTAKQIEFIFHRGGQKAIKQTAVCP